MSVYSYAKATASDAKKFNRQSETLSKLSPQFRKVKGELITIVGRC